jgi:peroxiredoxin Q/BCP
LGTESPKVGEIAPAFTAETNTGEKISLVDLKGRNSAVLFFFPKADTPG